MAKLFIATPMYGGMCAGSYAQSLLNVSSILQKEGHEVLMSFMFNESLITRARNALSQAFLKSDATHMMFIDADINFNPHDVLTMLNADKEVICGIYPKKEINWTTVKQAMDANVPNEQLKYHTGSFVVNLVDYAPSVTVPVDQPVEIQNGGTGFMMIKREVFEALKQHVPYYMNDVADLGNTMQPREQIYEFFATSIEEGTQRLLSEDYHFCAIYRKIGGHIYAAPWATLAHIGTYMFEGRLIPAP
jgi:hypothetical protein